VALLVDELGGVAPVDPASVQPVYRSNDLRDVLTGHVLGQAEHRGRSVLLLDHRRLITDEALLNAVEGSRMELEEA
jgi:chemotaxis signal transduction protein